MDADFEIEETGAGGDPGGVREERLTPDAPGVTTEVSPAGMELTFTTSDEPAVFEKPQKDSSREEELLLQQKRISFSPPPAETIDTAAATGQVRHATTERKPTKFREQFDSIMNRLEDRFQVERLNLEEKHSRELEEAMGYFSLSSGEREAKQKELQISLLDDIGSMAQQLHELTGVLGPGDDVENLTLPSDPKVLEEYARKMQELEAHFQKEKLQLERKHASEMEEALGTLKMTSHQREAKQVELQDQLSAEIGDMAKQLEDLNKAKEVYESKVGALKSQLIGENSAAQPGSQVHPNFQKFSRTLEDVKRERDAAQDELRRLKLALEVTGNPNPSVPSNRMQRGLINESRLSPLERENISSLRGRIEQMEIELKRAAATPGGRDKMVQLRERMAMIEKDLLDAEESMKEHYALESIRARMEKVERLLSEGERAAKEWEALEELRNKIGNVDNDLKAVEDAKKEYEALESLRGKMEEAEAELKEAERVVSDRQNVGILRARLGQVEKELGIAEAEDGASVGKLLTRLAQAEKSLEDARKSTNLNALPDNRGAPLAQPGNEVEKILDRLALAEKKLQAAKESAQQKNLAGAYRSIPQSATTFDERQSAIRTRLEQHLGETDPSRQSKVRAIPYSTRGSRSKFEEPRFVSGRSSNRYYVEDVQLDREVRPRPRYEESVGESRTGETTRTRTVQYQPVATSQSRHFEGPPIDPVVPASKTVSATSASNMRPLRRRHAGDDVNTKTSRAAPYSVFDDDDEDRYASDLEELRYQRSLLSQKLPKKKFGEGEEEKKTEEQEPAAPKFSFRQVLRDDERERLQDKIQRDRSPPKQRVDDAKERSDPPEKNKSMENSDPPSSLKDLQNGILERAQADLSTEGKDKGRLSTDPPDEATFFKTRAPQKDTPADKESRFVSIPVPVQMPEDIVSVGSTDEPAIVTDETLSPTAAKSSSNGQPKNALWWDQESEKQANKALPSSEPAGVALSLPGKETSAPQPPERPASPQPIINQTTVVDGKAAERANREKDSMMRWVVLILFLLAIVLAAVIVVVVWFLRDGNDVRADQPSSPTTLVPSMAPTSSSAPTISNAPSSSTAPTGEDSLPPLSFEGCPDLDNNSPLALDGTTTERSTVGATFDADELGACGSIEDVGSDGVWYYLFGNGGSVTLNTCTLSNLDFDTQVLVYTSVNQATGCRSGLTCVDSNDNFCGLQSSVTFRAAQNTVYFVYINGRNSNSGSSSATEGVFSLTAYTSPEGSCDGATVQNIEPNDGQLPVVVVGSLMGGTFGVDPCNPELDTRTGERWYIVEGNGAEVIVSTCHSISSFPARLAVYSGACDSLVCEAANDEDCGLGSEITWFAARGVTYKVLVYSPSFVPDTTFGITFMEA